MIEHEMLPSMDDDEARKERETRQALSAAADVYQRAPEHLKNVIIAAARGGMRPSEITRAIGYAYTYVYVGKLIRDDRKANPGEYKRAGGS